MAPCRSCGADVLWAVTSRGKPIPIDPEPRPDGNIVVDPVERGRPRSCHYATKLERAELTSLRVAHFVTCPDREKWRKKR